MAVNDMNPYIEIGSSRGEESMQVTRFIRSSFIRIGVAAVAIWLVGPTQAATFAVGDEALVAPPADAFTFQSGAGAAFESSSLVTTGYSATFFDRSLPIASNHAASIDIAAASPVPEPPARVLLLSGAVLLAWQLYRRRVEK